MSQTKLVINCVDFDRARSVAGHLEEILYPSPLAVTVFENGAPRHSVAAYFDASPDLDTVATILGSISSNGIDPPTLDIVPDENWVVVSQQALPPIKAGRFTVHGSHDRMTIAPGIGAIEIDAGEAFGTAHHATTLGCLLALDQLGHRQRMKHVLDLGCGSGVLAIAAARLFPDAEIIASDIDPIATTVASANARANKCGRRIQFVTAIGLDHPQLRKPTYFDLIVANILAGPLIALAPRLRSALSTNGRIILSGILVTQAAQVLAAYRSAGFVLDSRRDLTGWTVLQLTVR